MKQALKGQNVTNVDVSYTLVWDLLRDNALTAFNNKHSTIKNQSLENLEHCLNAVTVQVFPNKAYTFQKRHIFMRKWIARVIKLNNYLTKFPTPAGIEAKKPEEEEILEKPLFATRNMSQKRLRKAVQHVKATPREEGSTKLNTKLTKSHTMVGTKNTCNITPMFNDVTIASTMGIATTPQKSVGSPSTSAKDTLAMKGSANPVTTRRDLHMIINEKITLVLNHKEKKELNKFETLSILSDSNKDKDNNINSRVSDTSNKVMDLE
eukprot:3878778-Ditylum_brightwellii.AAC.1